MPLGFPGGSVVKNLPASAGDAQDVSSTLVLGWSPGEGNGNPFQCSCLENPMDKGAWQATVRACMLSRFQSCPTLCNAMDSIPPRFFCPWDSPDKNTGLGCHARLQGIFPTQGSNLCLLRLLHFKRILYCWATREAQAICSPLGST